MVESNIVEVDSALSRLDDGTCDRSLPLTRLENCLLFLAQAGMPPISSASWDTVMYGTLSFEAFASGIVL
jgi:hypothetical protein